jgi:gentisate 1,2-dioxygenase
MRLDLKAAPPAGAALDAFYDRLAPVHMEAGWHKTEPSMYATPKKKFVPAHWSYRTARAALAEAAGLVGTADAERRNLILYNPIPGNTYATAPTLVAAYQMIKGHEVARSHRHTANAMRFILEAGPEAYTVVNGKKVPMVPGDVLLTPNWAWHGHSNDDAADAYWIDFLDAPLAHLLGPMFFQQFAKAFVETTSEIAPDSPFRFAFADWGARLRQQPEIEPGLREIVLGPPLLDTIRIKWRLFSPDAKLAGSETTANCIYAVKDGTGTVECDGTHIDWARGDVFVVPAWRQAHWTVAEESYLLRVSDESLLEKINWLHTAEPGSEMEHAPDWAKAGF